MSDKVTGKWTLNFQDYNIYINGIITVSISSDIVIKLIPINTWFSDADPKETLDKYLLHKLRGEPL